MREILQLVACGQLITVTPVRVYMEIFHNWLSWFSYSCCCLVAKLCPAMYEPPPLRTAAHQALLSSAVSQGLLTFMSIASVMLPDHLILLYFLHVHWLKKGFEKISLSKWFVSKCIYIYMYTHIWGFPGGTMVKNLPINAGDERDVGSSPGSGRSPGVGNGKLLKYSRLENSMDRGGWQAAVHGVVKESDTSKHACTYTYIILNVSLKLPCLWRLKKKGT